MELRSLFYDVFYIAAKSADRNLSGIDRFSRSVRITQNEGEIIIYCFGESFFCLAGTHEQYFVSERHAIPSVSCEIVCFPLGREAAVHSVQRANQRCGQIGAADGLAAFQGKRSRYILQL